MMIEKLQCAENSVTRVAKTGNDICVLVEVVVKRCAVNIYVGMRLEHLGNALGSSNQAHKANVLAASLLWTL